MQSLYTESLSSLGNVVLIPSCPEAFGRLFLHALIIAKLVDFNELNKKKKTWLVALGLKDRSSDILCSDDQLRRSSRRFCKI